MPGIEESIQQLGVGYSGSSDRVGGVYIYIYIEKEFHVEMLVLLCDPLMWCADLSSMAGSSLFHLLFYWSIIISPHPKVLERQRRPVLTLTFRNRKVPEPGRPAWPLPSQNTAILAFKS